MPKIIRSDSRVLPSHIRIPKPGTRPKVGSPKDKSQIPSTKLQINLKFQYSMTQTYLGSFFKMMSGFGISNFGHCYLFVIWVLWFVISMLQSTILNLQSSRCLVLLAASCLLPVVLCLRLTAYYSLISLPRLPCRSDSHMVPKTHRSRKGLY